MNSWNYKKLGRRSRGGKKIVNLRGNRGPVHVLGMFRQTKDLPRVEEGV